MKKTLIALSLAASLVAGSAMALPREQTGAKNTSSAVMRSVQTLTNATAVAAEFGTASDAYTFLQVNYKLTANQVDATSGLLIAAATGAQVTQATAATAGKVLVVFASLPASGRANKASGEW